MHRSPAAIAHARAASPTEKSTYRELFRQQADRMWNADRDIDWSQGPQIPPEKRDAWLKMINVFWGLEYMGLDTIQIMMSRATHKLRDPNLNLYLAAQVHDEARHTYVLDRYLEVAGGKDRLSRLERGLIDRFGNLASFGLYRVENWLTSTLFSENFAALFLSKARQLDDVDPLASEIFRLILRDEVRHVNFLHSILPTLLDNLSAVGRAYIWQSQVMLIGAISIGMRRIRDDAVDIGIDVEEFKAELVDNLAVQFQDAHVDRFLKARTYQRVMNCFI